MNSEPPSIRVLAISGSLRRGSYNTAALRAAQELQPAGMYIEIADISGVPVFNEDTEAAGWPPAVADLRRRVAEADALLIATPEYNYSLPGVLKNAIDWLSRVDRESSHAKLPLNAKPLGIIGASVGHFGTVRAQLHLRQVCVYTNLQPLNRPEVHIGEAPQKFDAQGRLTDEHTREILRNFLSSFIDWIRLITSAKSV